jgi:type IV secretion system protein VirD4
MIQFIHLLFDGLFSVISSLIGTVIDFASAAIPSRRRTQFNADFISSSTLLSTQAKGFCLTGRESLSIEDSFSNAIVLGGTGSGKSSRILIPSILKMADTSSLIVHDPSGELFQKTSGALEQKGYEVKAINYSDPDCSEGYNPLHRVQSISDIQKISKLIVHTSLGQGKDPFWNTSAESLISLFIRYVVYYAPAEYRTLGNVLYLINTFGASGEKVDKLIVQSRDASLISDYKAFVAYDLKMLMSIVATARASLAIFGDPSVAAVTSFDTIDFDRFRHEKTVLYINNSVSDMRYYSAISSVFFEQFVGALMKRLPNKGELPIFFLLDEASSLYLNILSTAVSNIRKHSGGILQVYQHYNQMVDLYGVAQARNIAAICYTKVYMKGQSIETAKELESVLGKFEFTDDDDILRTRQLMAADEIRQLEESIILCGNKPPIKAKMIPYYEQKLLKTMTQLQPCTIESRKAPITPVLIPLPE